MDTRKLLLEAYPDLFMENPTIAVPKGWLEQVMRALNAFRALDIGRRIKNIVFTKSFEPQASVDGAAPYQEIFNRLIAPAGKTCMSCGCPLPETIPPKIPNEKIKLGQSVEDWGLPPEKPNHARLPICRACLVRGKIIPPISENTIKALHP